MSAADKLLSCLDGVKSTGRGRWMARCPAHADRTASLSIRELDDGRCIAHDFGGCSIDDVLRAVGLDLRDLFPEEVRYTADGQRAGRERRPFPVSDVVRALRRELTVAWLILADVAAGKALSDLDRQRAGVARDRCMALLHELGDD